MAVARIKPQTMASDFGDDAQRHAVDPAHFRRVLGNVATSVAIVSGFDWDGPFGLVVGSLVSISLQPALVGLFVDEGSSALSRLLEAERLCVNVLAAGLGALCRDFSRNRQSRFTCGNWTSGGGEPPRLKSALTWIAGPVERSLRVGDHFLIVIAAQELTANPDPAHNEPLVFFQGGFVGASERRA